MPSIKNNILPPSPTLSLSLYMLAGWLAGWHIILRLSTHTHTRFLSLSTHCLHTPYRTFLFYSILHSEHIGWLGKMESGDVSISPACLCDNSTENTLSQICDIAALYIGWWYSETVWHLFITVSRPLYRMVFGIAHVAYAPHRTFTMNGEEKENEKQTPQDNQSPLFQWNEK